MACQRFKITGTLAGGQTGLWIFVRQVYYCFRRLYVANVAK